MVYNLRNPHPAPWRELLTAVTDAAGGRLRMGPPTAWPETLRASVQELKRDELLTENQAVDLIDFFEKLWMATRVRLVACHSTS